MAVTVDHEELAAERLGLLTVGQVLSHVRRENRLVVNVLIDGAQPERDQLRGVKQRLLNGHTLSIETAEPRTMAAHVLREVGEQLKEAERISADAVELLGRNRPSKAMEKLSGCFSAWKNAQDAVLKTAQLLRIDLAGVFVGDLCLSELISSFAHRLRQIRAALDTRDFITLTDILAHEIPHATRQWRQALDEMVERSGQ